MRCFFVICVLFAAGCGKEKATKNPLSPPDTFNPVFSVGSGWDIYSGGGYRYGPSIIESGNGIVEAWFSAPGASFGEAVELFNRDGIHKAVPLSGTNTAAQKFSSSVPFYSIGVLCPSWQTTNSSISISLYKWQVDYTSTLKSAAIASKTYVNYTDNQSISLASESLFPAGEYFWVLSDAKGTAGVWKKEGSYSASVSYLNGQVVAPSFESRIFIAKSSGGLYWDQISYKKSTDGGKTWGPEQMVLKPTEFSRDELSNCDPGVIRFGGYYYIGYTSTEDVRGTDNHVYLARSVSATGPYEKWNGTGWGGNPQPVITYNGNPDFYGAGEPCMVIKEDSLFFYYSWIDEGKNETRVALSNTRDPNWPAGLRTKAVAVDKTGITAADHCDVKYRKDLKKFYAIHTASRLTPNSYLILWESSDGLRFTRKADIRSNLKAGLHNCGWSGDETGQIDPARPQYLSYAYGEGWANWNTYWHPISFK